MPLLVCSIKSRSMPDISCQFTVVVRSRGHRLPCYDHHRWRLPHSDETLEKKSDFFTKQLRSAAFPGKVWSKRIQVKPKVSLSSKAFDCAVSKALPGGQ